MTLTAALLDPLLAADPARPLVTFYDDATGERVELSATTLANWAAKTANLLRDELDVETAARVGVLLPAHWQTVAVLLGTWWCGAQVVADPAEAEVVLCDAAGLPAAQAAAPPSGIAALSLHALGRGLPDLPPGVLDYASEVRLHGDEFVPWGPVPGDAPALAGSSVAETLATARWQARTLGLGSADRVLSTRDWPVPDGVRGALLAVLAAGASLVQCRHADPDALENRYATERCTVRL